MLVAAARRAGPAALRGPRPSGRRGRPGDPGAGAAFRPDRERREPPGPGHRRRRALGARSHLPDRRGRTRTDAGRRPLRGRGPGSPGRAGHARRADAPDGDGGRGPPVRRGPARPGRRGRQGRRPCLRGRAPLPRGAERRSPHRSSVSTQPNAHRQRHPRAAETPAAPLDGRLARGRTRPRRGASSRLAANLSARVEAVREELAEKLAASRRRPLRPRRAGAGPDERARAGRRAALGQRAGAHGPRSAGGRPDPQPPGAGRRAPQRRGRRADRRRGRAHRQRGGGPPRPRRLHPGPGAGEAGRRDRPDHRAPGRPHRQRRAPLGPGHRRCRRTGRPGHRTDRPAQRALRRRARRPHPPERGAHRAPAGRGPPEDRRRGWPRPSAA